MNIIGKKRRAPTSSEHRDDLALAARCVEDPAAFEQLYRRHGPHVYGLALRLLHRPADAEDMVQEVFAKVFSVIGNYRGEASLSSWLHRITVRRCLRAMKRRPKAGPTLELVESHPEARERERSVNPERGAGQRRALERAHALLEQVNVRRRAVFLLHEVEGYSLPETAALLGISVSAAKKRVWRARRDIEKLARRDPVLKEELEGGRNE